MSVLAFDVFYRDHGAERGLDQLGNKLDKTHGKFSAFKSMALGFGAAAAVGIIKFGTDAARAFGESEDAAAQLTAAQARFPAILDVTTAAFNAQALALQKKIKFDDESITVGQATLAQFELTGKQIEALIPLVADYAQKSGKDMAEAATDVGKALLTGQGRALKAVGIEFTSTGDKAKDFALMQDLLRAKVGGAAEAAGTTATGKMAILKNEFGEIQEKVGAKLVPALIKLAEVGLKVVDWIGKNQAVMGPLLGVIGAVIVAQIAWNLAMMLNPIGLIVIGVAALVAGIVWLATKTQFFQTIWGASWGFIKKVAGVVFDFVVGGFLGWINFITSMPVRIAAAAKDMWGGIKNAFKEAINWIIKKWNALEFRIPELTFLGQTIGGFTLGLPDIPLLQRGTPFFGGGPAIVAERGPELLNLPRGTAVTPLPRDQHPSVDLDELLDALRHIAELIAALKLTVGPEGLALAVRAGEKKLRYAG